MTFVAPRWQAGRADLLRLIALADDRLEPEPGLEARLAWMLGFEREPDAPLLVPLPKAVASAGAAAALPVGAPLQAPMLGAAVIAETGDPGPDESDTSPTPPLAPLRQEDWGLDPLRKLARLPMPPIAPKPRVLVAMDRALRQVRPCGLDVPRLTHALARRELSGALPRGNVARLPARWTLVLDCRGALEPYLADMVHLLQWCERAFGGEGMAVCEIVDSADPLRGWVPVPTRRQRRAAQRSPASTVSILPWQAPAQGTTVVLVSDLGLASADAVPTRALPAAWSDWLTLMRSRGAKLVVWAPVPLRASVDKSLAETVCVVPWNACTPMRALPIARGKPHRTPERERAAQQVLALLAFAPWIDPLLIRSMRRLLGSHGADASIDQLVWSSDSLTRWPLARRIKPERLAQHRHAFTTLEPQAQRAVQDLATTHYAAFSPPLVHMHTLAWASRQGDAGHIKSWDGALRAQFVQALGFFERLAGAPVAAGVAAVEARLFMSRWLHHADEHEQRRFARLRGDVLAALQGLTGTESPASIPPGMPHAAAAQMLGQTGEPVLWAIVQDTEAGDIRLVRSPTSTSSWAGSCSPLAAELSMASADVEQPTVSARRLLVLAGAGDAVPLAPVHDDVRLVLRSANATVCIAPVRRPRGVTAWFRDRAGLHVLGPQFGQLELAARPHQIMLTIADDSRPDDPIGLLELRAQPGRTAEPRVQFGVDAFGVLVDILVGGVVQRLRWVEPGEFQMGSPDDEPERRVDEGPEGPRHLVHLTEGFWLADSACTRALWEAVMGENRSRFNGARELPVGDVSWDDVQRFLVRLQEQLPAGLQAQLPTEAQWEYACRAGTNTPFSLGAYIDPSVVNYDGNFPYAGGTKGAYRARAEPVKNLPPNAWGLHEMHGNVWEWCADGQRSYTAEPQQDPVGPVGGDRVVRGGSFLSGGGFCRSALRRAARPGFAYYDLGFRLALRSLAAPVPARDSEWPTRLAEGKDRQGSARRDSRLAFNSGARAKPKSRSKP